MLIGPSSPTTLTTSSVDSDQRTVDRQEHTVEGSDPNELKPGVAMIASNARLRIAEGRTVFTLGF